MAQAKKYINRFVFYQTIQVVTYFSVMSFFPYQVWSTIFETLSTPRDYEMLSTLSNLPIAV